VGKQIRVLQYGVGPIGAGIVRLMLEKRELEIVGAIDRDPAKVGKDLGQVAGVGRDVGVVVAHDLEGLLPAPAEVVVHTTSSYLTDVVDQLIECLEAGLHVVSTCEELSYPYRKHPALSEKLDACARAHNVALLGTGVNPGFAMDKLVLTLATACHKVNKVEVHRVVDASRRRLPLQKKVGAGMTEEEFRAQVAAGKIKHHGLPESVAMISDGIGLPVERIEETIDPVMATETVRSEFLEVPAGRVVGVHQIAHGFAGSATNVRLELEMYLGAREPVDAITIYGSPDLHLRVVGGIHGDLATTAIAVNCIPAILEAKPGLRTSRDIPMCFLPGA
jgi:4-hydroxy-tetrahydrodipicolinate reductase